MLTAKYNIISNSNGGNDRVSIQQLMNCINSDAITRFGQDVKNVLINNNVGLPNGCDGGKMPGMAIILNSWIKNYSFKHAIPNEPWQIYDDNINDPHKGAIPSECGNRRYPNNNDEFIIQTNQNIVPKINLTNELLATWLQLSGPLVVSINVEVYRIHSYIFNTVFARFFIFRNRHCGNILVGNYMYVNVNHAVTLFGFKNEGRGAWVVKNSLGDNGEEPGNFDQIFFDATEENTCGIGQQSMGFLGN